MLRGDIPITLPMYFYNVYDTIKSYISLDGEYIFDVKCK